MNDEHTHDYEYVWPPFALDVPAKPMTGPERMQAEIDELWKRVKHLELIVHRLLNQEGEL